MKRITTFTGFFLLLSSVIFSQTYSNRAEGHQSQPYRIPDNVKRIVFLGNSITYAGNYIVDIETYLKMRYPEKQYEIINVGLPSETVSDLSETGHAGGRFPRPDLHERLERVMTKIKPDLVIATYGMNDGIYMPFDEERFQKYKDGIRWLDDEVAKYGAGIIYVTPPVYDERKGEAYANVLDLYSDWLLSCRYSLGWNVIDTHWPMKKYLEDRRLIDSSFRYAEDGIHPDKTGHFIMAKQILLYLGEPEIAEADDMKSALSKYNNGDEVYTLIQERQKMMKDAWLTYTGHLRPGMNTGLPIDEALQKYQEMEKLINLQISGE
ncbi:MAG: SGNH/GDSL hydrolase family protein [Tannerella sp.]|jgi:lysophospholipase L1-like esterase|nr:SGNH/GDSL hydrolase family protein [Tannerella sp.]